MQQRTGQTGAGSVLQERGGDAEERTASFGPTRLGGDVRSDVEGFAGIVQRQAGLPEGVGGDLPRHRICRRRVPFGGVRRNGHSFDRRQRTAAALAQMVFGFQQEEDGTLGGGRRFGRQKMAPTAGLEGIDRSHQQEGRVAVGHGAGTGDEAHEAGALAKA